MAMTRKQNRLMIIGAAGLVLAAALTLVMIALNDEIVFFMTQLLTNFWILFHFSF